MTAIDLLFFDAGGGHRAAATALKSAAEQQRSEWVVRMVNLQEVLEPIDIFHNWTGRRMQDWYNLMLRAGWTLGTAHLLPAMHWLIARFHREIVRDMAAYWSRTRPDLVVSLVPNFNRSLREGLAQTFPHVPYVVILTDLADYPPHFWMEPQDEYVICGTDRAVEQAREMGHHPARIFCTSGMIIHPRFYEPITVDRRTERVRLGLDADRPTGLVLFGGEGAAVMKAITGGLNRSCPAVQLILMCGRNARVAAALRAMETDIPICVVGFTQDMPYYMSLADFFIGKPGPGSISEALMMRLPVIVERNALTLPQERFNTEWVRQQRVGLVVHSFRSDALLGAVAELLQPGTLEAYRARAAGLRNRAVWEILDILAAILADQDRTYGDSHWAE